MEGMASCTGGHHWWSNSQSPYMPERESRVSGEQVYTRKSGGGGHAGERRTTHSVQDESGRLTQFGHLRLQKKGMTHRYSSTPSKILVILGWVEVGTAK